MSNCTIKVSFTYNENSATCDLGVYPLFPVGWTSIDIDKKTSLEENYTGPAEFHYEMRTLLKRKFEDLVSKKIIKNFTIIKIIQI